MLRWWGPSGIPVAAARSGNAGYAYCRPLVSATPLSGQLLAVPLTSSSGQFTPRPPVGQQRPDGDGQAAEDQQDDQQWDDEQQPRGRLRHDGRRLEHSGRTSRSSIPELVGQPEVDLGPTSSQGGDRRDAASRALRRHGVGAPRTQRRPLSARGVRRDAGRPQADGRRRGHGRSASPRHRTWPPASARSPRSASARPGAAAGSPSSPPWSPLLERRGGGPFSPDDTGSAFTRP